MDDFETIKERIRKLSPAQRRMVDLAGIGNDGGIYDRRTIEIVVGYELLEPYTERGLQKYRMPQNVHMAWCCVCSEEIGDENFDEEIEENV